MTNVLIVAVLVAIAMGLLFVARGSGGDAGQLQAFLDRGALVLDVRTPGEFRRLHAKTARNIPVDELDARIGELGDPGPIVVYCASGMRSRRAKATLEAKGFEVLDMGRIAAFPPDQVEKQPNNAPV